MAAGDSASDIITKLQDLRVDDLDQVEECRRQIEEEKETLAELKEELEDLEEDRDGFAGELSDVSCS